MSDHKKYQQLAQLKRELKEEEGWRGEWAKAREEMKETPARPGDEEDEEKMIADMKTNIAQHDVKIAVLLKEIAELEETLPKKEEPAAPKFDPAKHPLLKKTVEVAEPAKPVVFNTGDMCEAQWTDRLWYKAKVQTILGAASNPKYHVLFVDYKDSTLTVDGDAIRPIPMDKKRKAEMALATPTVTPTVNSPHVISGPASLNPNAVPKQDSAGNQPGSRKNRKIGSNNALQKKKDNWKAFQSKGVGKAIANKESMFRSGTTVNSRVGFTGSGAGMTAVNKRVRYNTKADQAEARREDEDEDGTGPAFKGKERERKLVRY